MCVSPVFLLSLSGNADVFIISTLTCFLSYSPVYVYERITNSCVRAEARRCTQSSGEPRHHGLARSFPSGFPDPLGSSFFVVRLLRLAVASPPLAWSLQLLGDSGDSQDVRRLSRYPNNPSVTAYHQTTYWNWARTLKMARTAAGHRNTISLWYPLDATRLRVFLLQRKRKLNAPLRSSTLPNTT